MEDISDTEKYFVDIIRWQSKSFVIIRLRTDQNNTSKVSDDKLNTILSNKSFDEDTLKDLLDYFIGFDNINAALAAILLLFKKSTEVEKDRLSQSILILFDRRNAIFNSNNNDNDEYDIIYFQYSGTPLEILGPYHQNQDIKIFPFGNNDNDIYTDIVIYGNVKYIIIRNPNKTSEPKMFSAWLPTEELDDNQKTNELLQNLQNFVRKKGYNGNCILYLANKYYELEKKDIAFVFYLLYIQYSKNSEQYILNYVNNRIQEILQEMSVKELSHILIKE